MLRDVKTIGLRDVKTIGFYRDMEQLQLYHIEGQKRLSVLIDCLASRRSSDYVQGYVHDEESFVSVNIAASTIS